MTRRAQIWFVIAVVFTLVNVAGAGYAAAMQEGPHAGLHVALSVVGLVLMWLASRLGNPPVAAVPGGDQRLEYLQQSLDAVAVEVERLGEAQRFNAQLQSERARTEG